MTKSNNLFSYVPNYIVEWDIVDQYINAFNLSTHVLHLSGFLLANTVFVLDLNYTWLKHQLLSYSLLKESKLS
jgi:hypothetical protein